MAKAMAPGVFIGGGSTIQTDSASGFAAASMCQVDSASFDSIETDGCEAEEAELDCAMDDDYMPTTPASVKDNFTALINLQSANGSFQWGPVFLDLLKGKGMDEIMKASPNGENSGCWLTALAIKVRS